MRVIVCDSGPLLHLHEAKLDSLLGLAGSVHVPSAVRDEIVLLMPDWQATSLAWLQVNTLSAQAKSDAEDWVQASLLDLGEAEAIALARELKPNWLLTDDAVVLAEAKHALEQLFA